MYAVKPFKAIFPRSLKAFSYGLNHGESIIETPINGYAITAPKPLKLCSVSF